jgi:hypothetical protein
MIAVLGGAAAVSAMLSLVARGGSSANMAYGRALAQVNRWLLTPGLVAAPLAGVWRWSRHDWVLPKWLQYKLGLTVFGIIGAAMYLHLFRSELRPMLQAEVALEDGTGEATTGCRRVVAAASAFLLGAAAIGTLKPGW